MMESKSDRKSDWFRIVLALLISIVVIVSAVVGGRAALLADEAEVADSDGLDAVLNIQAVRTNNQSSLYQHYAAYTDFVRYERLGEALDWDLADQAFMTDAPLADPLVEDLENRREEAFDLASAGQFFFVSRYLKEGGGYDDQRELDEAWSEAARWQDLDPQRHFDRADRLRAQSSRLVGTLVVFAGALFFYTVASGLKGFVRYVSALLALLCHLGGVVIVLRIEGML
jgi:hypothetical protein